MDRDEAPVYPIGVMEKLTGLSARRIRYYEQAGLLHPQRSPGNQRLYTPADVARLREIKRLIDMGLNLAGIRARLQAGQAHPAPQVAAETPLPEEESDVQVRLVRQHALRSLYPVSNQAELEKVIDEIEGEEDSAGDGTRNPGPDRQRQGRVR